MIIKLNSKFTVPVIVCYQVPDRVINHRLQIKSEEQWQTDERHWGRWAGMFCHILVINRKLISSMNKMLSEHGCVRLNVLSMSI